MNKYHVESKGFKDLENSISSVEYERFGYEQPDVDPIKCDHSYAEALVKESVLVRIYLKRLKKLQNLLFHKNGKDAMRDELKSLIQNETYKVVNQQN